MNGENTFHVSKKIFDIIIREKFRLFARQNGIADHCVIDRDGYTKAPDMLGCFQKNEKWIVYETDDKGNVEDEQEFPGAGPAFQEIASRCGLAFCYEKRATIQDAEFSLHSLQEVQRDTSGMPGFEKVDVAIKNLEYVLRNHSKLWVQKKDPLSPAKKQLNVDFTIKQVFVGAQEFGVYGVYFAESPKIADSEKGSPFSCEEVTEFAAKTDKTG